MGNAEHLDHASAYHDHHSSWTMIITVIRIKVVKDIKHHDDAGQ